MAVKILHNDYPHRSIALSTPSHTLIFHHSTSHKSNGGTGSQVSLVDRDGNSPNTPQCAIEFAPTRRCNLEEYTPLTRHNCMGCLGLISIGRDIFLCVITSAKEVAQVRPGEVVSRILGVEFHCLNRIDYDHFLESEINNYQTESDGWDQGRSQQPLGVEHPCLAVKKLLSDGTFYYSSHFDLTSRLQDRSLNLDGFDIDSFDPGFMWNTHMITPLLQFRSHLSHDERSDLDDTRFLTCVIRGFVESLTIQRPMTAMESRSRSAGMPAMLTLISRLSCKRAGTRFNARGIDDDGNVANFVETETVIWNPGSSSNVESTGFSYCQIRGSIPIFWEQQTGLLPNQQKIQITRSPEATHPAFEKHMEGIVMKYGASHIVNLLSETKSGEAELSSRYRKHLRASSLAESRNQDQQGHHTAALLRNTEYDFHAETKGPSGYEAANAIRRIVASSAEAFGYFLMEGITKEKETESNYDVVLQQEGVFRTNCLDCLDRTNLVQGIFSRMAIESFLEQKNQGVGNDFWMRHSTLWADNGDALSKIYAGTGALKSSFTRTGKMSLAGAIADARKSVTRTYINNFTDKDRQNTMDVLLGRLVGQEPVGLYDPINDYVNSELNKRMPEFSTEMPIHIYCGTFNLNGRIPGLECDLREWLQFRGATERQPELVVIGFQEIVELSPQQIMATDPEQRKRWERVLLKCLNKHNTGDSYILLRSGQLVGAALMIFVRSTVIGQIKNVEGSLKKTGMSGVAGNKGAVAIRFEYANTRICFVTAHLAAGFSNVDERNRDYETISSGLRFQQGRRIENHDVVVWLGDFNYRIGLPDEKVRGLVQDGDLQYLYDNDQLHLSMVSGQAFQYYTEAKLNFLPTYKYDIGTNFYDSSEKHRVPAWCDRILWKGRRLNQLSYGSAQNIMFSDHRPVYAMFQCSVTIVNEELKTKLSKDLYAQAKANFKGTRVTLSNTGSSGHEEKQQYDLLDMEPLVPGLPPPSSEKQKWWLNDGLPAKSILDAPVGYTANPSRPYNPWSTSAEPDWVTMNSYNPSVHSQSTGGKPNSTPNPGPPLPGKRLPPPYDPATLPPLYGVPLLPQNNPIPAFSDLTVKSSPNPPPVPRKPVELRRRSLTGDLDLLTGGNGINGSNGIADNMPPPRRVSTMGTQPLQPYKLQPHNSGPPRRKPLPPPELPTRPPIGDLMDNGSQTTLDSWQPLKPS